MQANFNFGEYLKDFIFQEKITLENYEIKGAKTIIDFVELENSRIPKYINEFWTSQQRKASSIHEISYRACFKPQLPRFFIKLLTKPGDIVYDPFSGRGTTVIEAGLLNRKIISNDINPLSEIIGSPRFFPPNVAELEKRLNEIPYFENLKADLDLTMFYHKKTESEIVSLKNYLLSRNYSGNDDNLDKWIKMVATNRLTGHSTNFFSVYTLPPNQAVSQGSQMRINIKRNQIPTYRDTKKIILIKTKKLLKSLTSEERDNLVNVGKSALFLTEDARKTTSISSNSIQLTVTSPPFLDIVQYPVDNWLRCWFNGIDPELIGKKITMSKTIENWSRVMGDVFHELFRITKHGGWVAFEVGEVRKGKIKLDEFVVPLGLNSGFQVEGILINSQEFTKTSNIWGINNMKFGTNTNRIVIFKKE